ncbi:NFX1-type zinc finger-containing protein 1-like [Elysia marginata]|uniref:NFX1-type zinc finger-containing protein 1-like n=1 Tax=Elysia marginata TaxID=1093978 RepID=A0AAV4IZZ7_9GAST|nr:NFX1-type zinc finger-containing protein 1-like [Elysia marginata]
MYFHTRRNFRGRGGYAGANSRGRDYRTKFNPRPEPSYQKSSNWDNHGRGFGRHLHLYNENEKLPREVDGVNDRFAEKSQGRAPQDRGPRCMTYGRLKDWAGAEDPEDLALFMSNEIKQIESFLNQDSIKEDWYCLFVSAVDLMIKAHLQKTAINRVLDILCKSPFLEKHLTAFVLDKNFTSEWNGGQPFLDAMVRILDTLLKLFPFQSLKVITAVPHLTNLGKVFGLDEMVSKVKNIELKASEIYKAMKEQPKSRFGLTSVGESPPDDFSNESVLPTCKDIKEDKKIFVRPVVLDGGYTDKDHYLDVQFRLMKQDFVIPLRQGIREFQENGMKKHFNSSDLRMYFGVHILGIAAHDSIDHVLQFDSSRLKSVQWDFSKRLIFGSLVCLSKDGFETIAVATISNRDPKDLKKGQVNVNVKSGLDIIFNSTPNDEFVMAETVAFFESYCHVLEGLKEMRENLPLQEHIVSCEKRVKPPQYLLHGMNSPSYDLSPFMNDTSSVEVPVLLTTKWPSSDKMCLNESQREAAQMALTKRLAVIQGPPGTGKTYVGLKVVETILKNQGLKAQVDSTTINDYPILVVCYTNHALDQFLEGIMQFCTDGIIRVGGRSKSSVLEQCNLKNKRKAMKNAKELSSISMEKSRKECHWRLKTLIKKIEDTAKGMEHIDFGICSKEKLLSYNVIKDEHKNSLLCDIQDGFAHKGSVLRRWLNVKNEDPVESVAKIIEDKMTKLILDGNFSSNYCKPSEQMPVEARATFYLVCIANLIEQLQKIIQILKPEEAFQRVKENIEKHYRTLDLCRREIVPDHVIRPVMDSKLFKNIESFVGRKATPNQVIKTWLLGLHKCQHEQLNDIERLLNKGVESNSQTEPDLELDDVKRVMADDGDDKDFDEAYLAKTRSLKNSFASVIHRLEELGLDQEVEQTSKKNEGWQEVSKPLNYTKMRKKIHKTKPMTKEQEELVTDIWDLTMKERFALYKLWMERCKMVLSLEMESLVKQYERTLAEKNEIIGQETVSILRKATVIGMTTTGAARYRSVLQAVGCRIIVVEEAAEVLEAHIVTALNKYCEHLILIGDHQQLRPSPVVYELAKVYGLEISLFERLVKNQFPHIVLQEQHRMRPEISKIMRHIYPDLKDHPVVSSYDIVQGVAKNFFLVKHTEAESSVEDTRSRANMFEAAYVTKLCSYLLLQGYEPSQITILATYAGQVLAIKKSMKVSNLNSPVRVTSVDNFQGEENDIIILSLVRSNENKSIGFLKVDNRVCVALSRAKKGLFIIGNFELLSLQSKLWHRILSSAQADGSVGDGLPVVCKNHPDEEQLMFTAVDFDKRPLGGCGRPCNYRLNCGHLCEMTCHGYDLLHKKYLCKKQCTKTCDHGHPCQKKCFEDCGKCYVKVPKIIPGCGHEDLVPCYLPPENATCSKPCEKVLDDCEHQCSGKCGHCKKMSQHALCTKQVSYLWPCGHFEQVECHKKPSKYPCPHPCETILNCGHLCKGTCSSCLQGKVHLACKEPCEKKLPCGHKCENYCSAPCKPCLQSCPSKCRHGGCHKNDKDGGNCGHICIPCKEKCMHHCKCQHCENLCSEPCSIQPCDKRCKQTLRCKHKCSGLCGELCVCGICSKINTITKRLETRDAKKETSEEQSDKVSAAAVLESESFKSRSNSLSKTTEQMSKEASKSLPKDVSSTDIIQNQNILDSPENEADKIMDYSVCSDTIRKSTEGFKPLLRLPVCDHVFYVDELDNYVSSFEPGGSSFIPCPVCQTPIQRCAHYEHINQTRAKKRIKLKKALIKETEVLAPEKNALKDNLEAYSKLSEIFGKVDPYAVKHKGEILAWSFKLKLTFVLNEIDSLKPYIVDDSEFNQLISTRKDAVLRIGKYYTAQQKQEFIVDLACSLCRAMVIKAKDIDRNDSEEVPASITTMTEKQQSFVREGGMNRFLELTEEKINSFIEVKKKVLISSDSLTAALQYDVIGKHVKSIFEVLRSQDNEFLCDIISCRQISKSQT